MRVMHVAKTFTVLAFLVSVALDLLSSLTLLRLGYVEMNPLYPVIGSWFWLLKLVINAGLLGLLWACSKKWWWTYLILWIASMGQFVCGIHNLGLLL